MVVAGCCCPGRPWIRRCKGQVVIWSLQGKFELSWVISPTLYLPVFPLICAAPGAVPYLGGGREGGRGGG